MKKVLFATTALIATSGMAAAEVTFGGFGRFGLFYQEGNDATVGNDDMRIEQRFRLTATGTATADNGLEFEGRIRWQTDDQANGNSNIASRSSAGFAVSTGGFRLDVGNVSDVIDSGDVVNYYGYGVGLTSFAEQSSAFNGIPASGFGVASDDSETTPTVKLRYTMGDFTVSASVTDGTSSQQVVTAPSTDAVTTEREEYQIGFGYNFGNYSVGLAFGNEETTTITEAGGAGGVATSAVTLDNDFWAISFDGEIGAFAFSILVGDSDSNDETMYGFSVKYDVSDATEIRFAFSDSGLDAEDEVVAIGFRHGLGGGVSLRGGIGQNTSGNTVADLGVIFNF
ncbi:porin [uncultured Tateyamaria sp.]|uniref:porin n=1 Tax=Tateyamaria sp. 1078 TaxID=3417464 RepID=UPI0026075069|nr:porin [uncultured Tateyamaria sp.]